MEEPRSGIVRKDYEKRMYLPWIKMGYNITVTVTLGEVTSFQTNASKG